MFLDKINLNHLRVFECVYRHQSMTRAAEELHLTQSGVSQHVATLEEMLEVSLFDRLKQHLVPTPAGRHLFTQSTLALNGIESALSDLKGGEQRLAGPISLGLPIEFGNNLVIPLVSEFAQMHPLIKLTITYGFASEMNTKLLAGQLDFAFIDAYAMDRQIRLEAVYNEELFLVASQALLRRKKLTLPKSFAKSTRAEQKAFLEKLDYVDYQAGAPILQMWLAHELGPKPMNLPLRAVLMDVLGVAGVIRSGLAAGVLPGHLYERIRREDPDLFALEGASGPLINRISIADLPTRTTSLAARKLREFCLQRLK